MTITALLNFLGNGKPGDAHTAGYGAQRYGPFATDPKAREPFATTAATSTSVTRSYHHGLRTSSSTTDPRMISLERTSQGSINYELPKSFLLLCLIVDTSIAMTSGVLIIALAFLSTIYHLLSLLHGCLSQDSMI
jgi:hypothetical protein